jgi:hypothetical protein
MSVHSRGAVLPTADDNYPDLCSTEVAQIFAWACYLIGDVLEAESPGLVKRMEAEVLRRVILPYIERDDYWWMGFTEDRINNWNPWCNSNIIQTAALMNFEPELRARVIERACQSLDIYFDRYPMDGACDEGPMYWGAAGGGFATCVELLKELTHGAIDGSKAEKLKNIGTYFSKVHIHGDWMVDYADGDAHVGVGAGVYRFGKLIGDEALIRFGAMAEASPPAIYSWFPVYGYLITMFDAAERKAADARAPYIKRAWFGDCQILCARENAGSEKGFFLSAKAGNNWESHNHNDVGNLIVFLDGKPLFIDLGTEEYKVQTFSPQRFELWYLQSQYHNCPTINGIMQHENRPYKAAWAKYERTDSRDTVTMDIAGAYPIETNAESFVRSVSLKRGDNAAVTVTDEYRFNEPPTQGTAWNWMTLYEPKLTEEGIVIDCEGSAAVLKYDRDKLCAVIEEKPLEDSRLRQNWGGRVYRVVLTQKQPEISGAASFEIVRR